MTTPASHEAINRVEIDDGHQAEKTISLLDNLGIAASTLCLIHCLAMPFIVGMLPLIGLSCLESHESHLWLASAIVIFALTAIVPGYLRHKRMDILILMIVGVSLVLFASFGAEHLLGLSWELPLIAGGNLILVGTHLRNRGLCKCTH